MPVSSPQKRPTRWGRAFLLFGGAALCGALAVRLGDLAASRAASRPPALPSASVPIRGERVLVVAPHPDDETLALGGLIHHAARRGADVRVVFLTSGDGFPLCAAAHYRQWPSNGTMRRLAGHRQQEARAALAALGVGADRLTFLGYPDRGLAELWLNRWEPGDPYRSRYTGASAVTDTRARTPGAPYCGRSVLRDLEGVLAGVRPERVYLPDSLDDHPDHWATHCFARMALARLEASGRPVPYARTYLVHRGHWPAPLGEQSGLFLTPPADTARLPVHWETLALDGESQAAKKAALRAYASQTALAGNFLKAFLRRNELLSDWPEPQPGDAPELRPAAPSRPDADLLSLPDMVHDRWGRSRCAGVDFTRLEVSGTADTLRLRAHLRGDMAPWATYRICWKPLSGPAEQAGTRSYRFQGFRVSPPDTRFILRGRSLEVEVPRRELPTGDLLVAAFVESGPVLLDRSPWYRVRTGSLGEGFHGREVQTSKAVGRVEPNLLDH